MAVIRKKPVTEDKMTVKSSILDAVEAAGSKARYDAQVKWILGNKPILAWILRDAAEELRGYDIDTITECIEGEPLISSLPVHPGKTNAERITGMNTENSIPGEGEITYDILFHVMVPGGSRIKLIVNVEAQKKFHTPYDLVTRGIFYCARMLSAQMNTEFRIPEYDDIKKVYSIWICMDTPQYAENTITRYEISEKKIVGNYTGRARYDLLSAVMICLGKADINSEEATLHGLLSTLLSERLKPEQKEEILSRKYRIPATAEMKEAINLMCNLSDLVEERGIEKGLKQGIEKGIEQGIEKGIEQGIEQGIKKGKLEMLLQLVREHVLSEMDAAKRLGMTEGEFKKLV